MLFRCFVISLFRCLGVLLLWGNKKKHPVGDASLFRMLGFCFNECVVAFHHSLVVALGLGFALHAFQIAGVPEADGFLDVAFWVVTLLILDEHAYALVDAVAVVVVVLFVAGKDVALANEDFRNLKVTYVLSAR